jgi:putative transposase
MTQSPGRRYVRHVNAAHGRSGTLWEGRYRAAPIDSEAHFLACCRYIELNPVRAGMVRRPRDYRWSSHRAQALGAADALVAEHPLYRALGRSAAERQAAYRALFRGALDEAFVDALRRAAAPGTPGEAARRPAADQSTLTPILSQWSRARSGSCGKTKSFDWKR